MKTSKKLTDKVLFEMGAELNKKYRFGGQADLVLTIGSALFFFQKGSGLSKKNSYLIVYDSFAQEVDTVADMLGFIADMFVRSGRKQKACEIKQALDAA